MAAAAIARTTTTTISSTIVNAARDAGLVGLCLRARVMGRGRARARALVAGDDVGVLALAARLAVRAEAVDVEVEVDLARDADLVRIAPRVGELVLVEERALALAELDELEVAGERAEALGRHVHAHLVRDGLGVGARGLALGEADPLRDARHDERGEDRHDGHGDDQLDEREGAADGTAGAAVGSHGVPGRI
jgi:hypothetical protein